MKRIVPVFLLLISTSCFHNGEAAFKVFKYDGSLQCNPGSGTDLATMAQELINAGIDVICAQKGHDGMARVTVCGAETGNINVYTIPPESGPDADAIGFTPVERLPSYVDEACH